MGRRVTYDLENVYLNGSKVIGVESASVSQSTPREPVSIMGQGYIGMATQSEQDKTFDFSIYTCQQEISILETMGREATGVYAYRANSAEENQKTWVANSVYLKSYELSCGVGQIAKSNFSFDCMGEASTSGQMAASDETASLIVARPCDVSVDTSSSIEDRNYLQSFSYKVEIPINRRHFIGGEFVPTPKFNEPISVVVDFELLLQDVSGIQSNEAFCENGFSGVFNLENCGTPIRQLLIRDAKMTSCSVNGEIGDGATLNYSYQAYLNSFDQLGAFVFGDGWSSSSSTSSSSSSVSSSSSMSSSSRSSSSSNSSSSSSSRSSSSTSSSASSAGVEPYIVDFEDGTKTDYGAGTVELNGYDWRLDEVLIGTTASDKKNGAKSARFSINGGGSITLISSAEHLNGYEGGLSFVSFNYAGYGGDTAGRDIYVEYSINGTDWTQIGNTISGPYPSSLTEWSYEMPSPIDSDIFLRIRRQTGTALALSRINIDDITIIGAS